MFRQPGARRAQRLDDYVVADGAPATGQTLFIAAPPVAEPDKVARALKRVVPFVLLGYILFDKSFAWIHVPGIPIFAGEVLLVLGGLLLIRRQRHLRALLTRSSLMRVAGFLFLWGIIRLMFDLPVWGVQAMRDASQTNYILIGIAVAVLTFQDPRILERLGKIRGWIPALIVIWVPIAVVLNRLVGPRAPLIPGSETTIVSFKPGDYAMFAAAAISYVWVTRDQYTKNYRNFVTLVGVVGILVAGSQNRGGLIGAIVALAIAGLFLDRTSRFRFVSGMTLAVIGLVVVLAITDFAIPLGKRSFSFSQLINNAASVVGDHSDDGQLQGTVSWRLDYWGLIVSDTVSGDNWLSGVGFGPNLADEYGFQTSVRGSTQPLRNAHNSHVTILARLGLVGLFLWAIFWAQTGMLLSRSNRRRTEPLVGWLLAVMVGIAIIAIFDPVLEGPQIAVPFWCAAGVVAGSVASRGVARSGLRGRRAYSGE